VQKLLRQTLMVPANMPVAPNYTDAASFKRLYDSMLDRAVDEAMPRFSASLADFAHGGPHYQLGQDAARAAIVPPVALVLTLVCVWTAFSFMQNGITRSDLFQQMSRADTCRDDESLGEAMRRRVLANIAHVVVVGQAYTYPFNEAVRTHVLGGLRFGYHGS